MRKDSINELAEHLRHDYPTLSFYKGNKARWVASEHKIYYADDAAELLHELGHAILGHTTYRQDIELLRIERDAWNKALDLAPHYHVTIDDTAIENALDSYRDWLHHRSLCPKCQQTGIQSRTNLLYTCPNCHTRWQANDSRQHQLKRHII